MQTNIEQSMTGQQGQQQMCETNQQQFHSATNRDCQRRYNLHHINIEISTQCTCTACFGASTPSRLPFASKKLSLDTQMFGLFHAEIQSFAQNYIKHLSSQFQHIPPPTERYCQKQQQYHNQQRHDNQHQHINQDHHDIHQQQHVPEASSRPPVPADAALNSSTITEATSGNMSPMLDVIDEESDNQETDLTSYESLETFDAPSPKESMDRMRQLIAPENYHLIHSPQHGDCVCLLGSVFPSRSHADVLRLLERWRLSDPQTRMDWKWSSNDLPIALSGRTKLKALERLRYTKSGGRADFGDISGSLAALSRHRQFLLMLYCMHGHPSRRDTMQKEGYCPHCFAKVSKSLGGHQSNATKLVRHFRMEHTENSVRGRPSSTSALYAEELIATPGGVPPFFSDLPSVTEAVVEPENSIDRKPFSSQYLPMQVSNESTRPEQAPDRSEPRRACDEISDESPSSTPMSDSPLPGRQFYSDASSARIPLVKSEIDEPSRDESARREATLSRPTYHVKRALEAGNCGCLVGSRYLDKSITKRHVLERLERWRKLNIADQLAWRWNINDLPKDIQSKNIEKVERARNEYSGGRNNFGGKSGVNINTVSGIRQLLLMLYCLRGHPGRNDPMQREGYCPHCFARIMTTNGRSILSRVIIHFLRHVDRTVEIDD